MISGAAQRLKQSTDLLRRIVGTHNAAHHRNSGGASGDRVGDIGGAHAADRHDRHRRRARDLGETRVSKRGPVTGLAPRVVERPGDNVIDHPCIDGSRPGRTMH